jgi:hypothetical protein
MKFKVVKLKHCSDETLVVLTVDELSAENARLAKFLQ